MKKIIIYQENVEPIILNDNDYSDFSLYVSKLSEILKYKEVTILETTSESLILKPSKICMISVSNIQEQKDNIPEETDIITDGD